MVVFVHEPDVFVSNVLRRLALAVERSRGLDQCITTFDPDDHIRPVFRNAGAMDTVAAIETLDWDIFVEELVVDRTCEDDSGLCLLEDSI